MSRIRTGLVVALSGVGLIILIIRTYQLQRGLSIKGMLPKPIVSAGRRTSSAITVPTMEEVIPAEKLFNSPYPLPKIKELETDGRTAPRREDVMAGLGEIYNTTRQNTSPSVVTGKPNEQVMLKAERWKVKYIGCFHDDKELLKVPKMIQVPSLTECFSHCDKLGHSYAAVSAGDSCTCGESMSNKLVNMIANKDELCDMSCPRESKGRYCGGQKFASVYMITIHGQESITHSVVDQSSYGCFEKPTDIESVFQKRQYLNNQTVAHCLVYCEKLLEPIAAWDPQSEECMCGKFDGRLSLSGLAAGAVNRTICHDKYCKNTKHCNVRYVTFIRTYAEDKRCASKGFLSTANGSVVALASLPGSGNTWTRHLVEGAVGIYTGSVYSSQNTYQKGYIGELLPYASRRTSVIKTHAGSANSARSFEAAILLIRSPYDAFVSERNRRAGGKVGYATPESFKTKGWEYSVHAKPTKWLNMITYFSEMKRVHVIYYEDLKANPIEEVKKIIRFLEIPVPNLDDRLHCLISDLDGEFKRKPRSLGFDPFTSSMKKKVDLYIKRGRDILQKKGLPTMPDYERLGL